MQSFDDERFSRLTAMVEYPAAAVQKARVVVGGVGALGNEVVKNLCLLGFRNLFLIDMDTVERSNLTRSVLFTETDLGKAKIHAAATAARRIYPEVRISGHFGDVATVGFGVFRRADLIFSDFDGFYPRIFLNAAALKVKKPWIDAALGVDPRRGSVMLYNATRPDTACFVCRIGVQTAIEELLEIEGLIGCQQLDRDRVAAGFMPTSPTTSAAIAAVQTQAGLDLLRLGLSDDNLWTRSGMALNLGTLSAAKLKLQRMDGCPEHAGDRGIDAGSFLEAATWQSHRTTIGQAFNEVREFLALRAAEPLYLSYHTLFKGLAHCLDCSATAAIFKPVYVVEARKKRGIPVECPHCGSPNLEADDDFGEISAVEQREFPRPDLTLAAAGFRRLDILKFFALRDDRELICHAEITGDQEQVFQPLVQGSS